MQLNESHISIQSISKLLYSVQTVLLNYCPDLLSIVIALIRKKFKYMFYFTAYNWISRVFSIRAEITLIQ